MCGIIVAFTPGRPTRAGDMVAMGRVLRHRGPDDEGYLCGEATGALPFAGPDTPAAVVHEATPWQPQGCIDERDGRSAALWLGHRRLAIVDLSPLGHQPMRRGDLWAVYNGEVYNHLELRAELEALGHRFASHSDTEVLLAAWQQWGPQALARCNGMWAFAIYDARQRRLFVARDRFGVKPLYVWRGAGGALVLASEVKALLAHPSVAAQPSESECADFLRHGPRVWREETEFGGIHRFPAGHWAELALDAPARIEPRAYWRRPEADVNAARERFDGPRAELLRARYVDLLDDAVRVRMRADVRIGTALSGGLDSSSIALLVNDELHRRGAAEKQEVFSSVYRAPGLAPFDESSFIESVAQRLDVRSNRIEPQPDEVPAEHERMVWALDTPAPNTLMSSWHTFRLVAERGVVVTLDGQGADEQLAGYTGYLRNLLVHQNAGAALREVAAFAGGMRGVRTDLALGLAGQAVRRLAGRDALATVARRLGMGSDPSLSLAEAMARDFDGNLRNLLLYADKTAMAWSVESRMPFMDYRLVEFLAGVAPAYKIHAGWTKWLARAALAARLPADVVWRRDKMGWPIPEAVWFGGPLADWLRRSSESSAFARDVANRAGFVARSSRERLRLANLAVWHRLFFGEPARPGRPLGRSMGRR